MNKKDLAKKILERNTTLDSQAQVARILDSMIDVIAETLATGEEVNIKGLVKFKKVKRAARTGRNPQTGAAIQIPEKEVVVAKASKSLSE